jgi:hypothetical protein
MATKHRRIAVIADPELEAALGAARREIGDVAEARLVRELALRGARDIRPEPNAKAIAELKRAGVAWPTRTLRDALAADPAAASPDPDDPYRGTRALDDVRADRA